MSNFRRTLAACLPLVLALPACVNRPLPHRVSLDELVQKAILQSQSYKGGDENLIHRDHQSAPVPLLLPAPVTIPVPETYEQELPPFAKSETPPTLLPLVSVPSSKDSPVQTVAFLDENRLTEEFIETEVREALTTLALQSDVDLVMDDNVTGIVNTRIDNLTIDEAIEKVILPLGYCSARRDNQIIVATTEPNSPLFSYIAVAKQYQPMHLDVSTMMETVPKDHLPYVTQVEQAKTILVEAPPRIADEIIARFVRVDQPAPQVVLEAIICVVSPDSGFQFGLDWNHAVKLDGAESLAIGASGLALNGKVSNAGLQNVFSDFSSTSAFIRLLCEHGYLTIRATPHVMAKDGEQANIAIARETFFSVQPAGSTGDNAVFFQQSIQKVDAGIMLDITPHIRGDVVTVDIEKAEVSEDVRTASTELSVNPFPIINRRSVSTTVSVKDGKTIVIGGLVQSETIDRVNKIPGLSRLPLVGYLFQTTERQTRDAEVVIFISPRIVRSAETVCISP